MKLPLNGRRTTAISVAALGLTLLAQLTAHATIDPVDAGRVIAWGRADSPAPAPPAELEGVPIADVTCSSYARGFLTADGRVVVQSDDVQVAPPTELPQGDVAALTFRGGTFTALTDEGNLVTWPSNGETPPPAATDLIQVALGAGFTVAVKADHSVVAWGVNNYGQTDIPVGLSGVAKVAVGNDHVYALKLDGTVVAWGRDQSKQVSHLPAAFSTPGTVKDIAARTAGGLALMNDGSVASWGALATAGLGTMVNTPPAGLAGKTISRIAAAGSAVNLAIDSDGQVTTWGSDSSLPNAVPAGFDGRTVSAVCVDSKMAYVVQPAVMAMTPSSVTGTAKRGSTLTGTPATFSGSPTITHQWLANGTAIEGAITPTLTLGSAQVGKTITFRTIATQGEEVVTSDSTTTALVADLVVPKAASRTAIAKPKVKRTKASITVKVTRSGGTPTGKVTLTVARGTKKVAKKVAKKSLVLKGGKASLVLKRLKKGQYKVTATYTGDTKTKPSTAASVRFRVR